LRRHFHNAVGKEFGSANRVGFEQFKDKVVPGLVGIQPEAERTGALEKLREIFFVQFVDPELGRDRRDGWLGGRSGFAVAR
jgi:hypothetical protein